MNKAALFFAISLLAIVARANTVLIPLDDSDKVLREWDIAKNKDGSLKHAPWPDKPLHDCAKYDEIRTKAMSQTKAYCESQANYRGLADCRHQNDCDTKKMSCETLTREIRENCGFYQRNKNSNRMCDVHNEDRVNPSYLSPVGTNLRTYSPEDETFLSQCPKAKLAPVRAKASAPTPRPYKKPNPRGTECLQVNCSGT